MTKQANRHAGGRLARGLVGAWLFAAATWSVPAAATPEFPAVVVKALGLADVTVGRPQGCTLCHATDSGGTALRPFGSLVQQDGTQPYADATLEQALAQIAHDEPQLIADIKAGADPNTDPSATKDPTVQYGCSLGRRRDAGFVGWAAVLAAVIGAFGARRMGTRRGPGRARQKLA